MFPHGGGTLVDLVQPRRKVLFQEQGIGKIKTAGLGQRIAKHWCPQEPCRQMSPAGIQKSRQIGNGAGPVGLGNQAKGQTQGQCRLSLGRHASIGSEELVAKRTHNAEVQMAIPFFQRGVPQHSGRLGY